MSTRLAHTRLREDFANMSGLLGTLFGFAALTLFAEGLYRPLKRLGIELYSQNDRAIDQFQETLAPLLPALLLLGALWQVKRLFQQLAEGELLSSATAMLLRYVSSWIIASAIAGLIVGELVVGTRTGWAFMVGLGVIGVTFWSLATVVDHAAAVQADLEQIV